MKVNLVPIGNSKGIRIPATVLKHCKISSELELEIEKDRLVLKPVKKVSRKGWDAAFQCMHERKEDVPLLDETIDMKDWEWR